jgi:hypothetical protein
MKTKVQFLLGVGLLVSLLCGCSTTANLYPVKGPLSEVKPLPIIRARVTGIMGNSGGITLTMPDGETGKGQWSSAAGMSVTYGSGTLFSQYGSAYWSGYSVGNKPGENRGQAIVIGDRDTVIEVEFYTGSGTANGFGLAKDNKGNIYKVLF